MFKDSFLILNDSDRNDKQDMIKNIKDFIVSKYKFCDIAIATNIVNSIAFNDMALLPLYYVKFHQGKIIFTSIEDYLEYRDTIIAKPIVYVDKAKEDLDTNLLKNVCIIFNNDSNLEMIEQHEL